jgi:hypothetical protein
LLSTAHRKKQGRNARYNNAYQSRTEPKSGRNSPC